MIMPWRVEVGPTVHILLFSEEARLGLWSWFRLDQRSLAETEEGRCDVVVKEVWRIVGGRGISDETVSLKS